MFFVGFFVGALVLLSGVIGISNIMLIVVKERTKEIGIRRAIGATPKEIRIQIILESVFLTIIAGIIALSASIFAYRMMPKKVTDSEDKQLKEEE